MLKKQRHLKPSLIQIVLLFIWILQNYILFVWNILMVLISQKIYLTIQSVPQTTNSGGSSSAQTDIDQLATAIKQQYKDAHDFKEETF